ncbi:MAG: alpha/beta hydrolase [Chloroflexi bacterium]|nr:MAG: alpha/beta hydrolase [Chloroflexota bacterium]
MPHVQLPAFRMHYLERGHGPAPLVFLHGYLSSHRWWLPALDRLPEGTRAYAIDLRGVGHSDPIEEGHTLAQYSRDLQDFITALGLEQFTLVAHSMGGQIATLYALEHPERLKKLLLVSPVAASGNQLPPEVLDWCRAEYGKPETVRLILQGAFAKLPAPEFFEELVRDGNDWGRTIYMATLDEMVAFDVAGELGRIQTPTLLLWGDKDTAVPFPGIVEYFNGIPDCGLEVWHGVGHSAPIERPDRFADLLAGFLAES